jgi:hypothetical protein
MTELGEAFAGLAADALRGRVRGDEFGMGGLEFLEVAHEGVVFGVGDLGRIEDVIEMLVPAELLA